MTETLTPQHIAEEALSDSLASAWAHFFSDKEQEQNIGKGMVDTFRKKLTKLESENSGKWQQIVGSALYHVTKDVSLTLDSFGEDFTEELRNHMVLLLTQFIKIIDEKYE